MEKIKNWPFFCREGSSRQKAAGDINALYCSRAWAELETLQAGGSLVASPWIYWEFVFPITLICFLWFSEKERNAQRSWESLFGKGWSCLSLFPSCSLGMFGLCLNWLILYSPTTLLAVGKEEKDGKKKKKKNNPDRKTWMQQAKKGEKKLCFCTIFKRRKTKPEKKKGAGIYQQWGLGSAVIQSKYFSPARAWVWHRKMQIQVGRVTYMFRQHGFCIWSQIRIILRINIYMYLCFSPEQ